MARPTIAELETIRAELQSAKAEYAKLSKLLNESMSKINTWDTKSDELSEQDDRISALLESTETQEQQLTELINKNEELQRQLFAKDQKLTTLEASLIKADNDLKIKQVNVDKLSTQVSSLLPKAATASLSSAFKIRRESFQWSKRGWTVSFIISVGLLLCFAWQFPPPTIDELKTTFDPLWGYLLGRLPLILPLFFLLAYSAMRMGQISKLEEEYAHKEALATSFEGFKKQLIELEKEFDNRESEDTDNNQNKQQLSMTLKLVQDTLEAISYHPRYVFTHEEKPTFMGKIIEMIKVIKGK
jgi:DNA repair exonuclease SbcCD ATPase subunit